MNSDYAGALRENNKIIYFVPDTSSNEYVLYNFNLNLGDTIIRPYGEAVCSNDTVTIQQVDSVLLSDGYNRQLYLSSSATWIEGVGSLNYLLNPCNVLCVSGNDILQCMISDLPFTYPSTAGSCTISVSEQKKFSDNISIYPNPVTDISEINLNGKFVLLEIYNMIGEKIKSENINGKITVYVNNKDFNKGSFIYKIIAANRTFITGKFIIQ